MVLIEFVMFAVFVILPQFCLILLGYLLTKRPSFAKKDFWNVTEKLVFYVLFPPLIFLSVAKANLQIGQCSYFLLISISAMSIAVITAWLANFLREPMDKMVYLPLRIPIQYLYRFCHLLNAFRR